MSSQIFPLYPATISITNALTATDVANALTAANAHGAVSREWFAQWHDLTPASVPVWTGVATSFSSPASQATISVVDGIGAVLNLSTSTNSTVGNRATMGTSLNVFEFGSLYAFKFAARVRRANSNNFDAVTNTGYALVGFFDSGWFWAPLDGCFFHALNGQNWFAISMANGVSTTTDTGIAFDTTWRTLEIDINLAGTSAIYKIDGVQVAEHGTTHIPKGAGRQTGLWIKVQKDSATSYAVDLQSAWAFLRTISPGALFLN